MKLIGLKKGREKDRGIGNMHQNRAVIQYQMQKTVSNMFDYCRILTVEK